MKQYFIVENEKKSSILYIGKQSKVDTFVKVRGGEARVATNEEAKYIQKHRLQHLNTFVLPKGGEDDVQAVDEKIVDAQVDTVGLVDVKDKGKADDADVVIEQTDEVVEDKVVKDEVVEDKVVDVVEEKPATKKKSTKK